MWCSSSVVICRKLCVITSKKNQKVCKTSRKLRCGCRNVCVCVELKTNLVIFSLVELFWCWKCWLISFFMFDCSTFLPASGYTHFASERKIKSNSGHKCEYKSPVRSIITVSKSWQFSSHVIVWSAPAIFVYGPCYCLFSS